MELHQIDPIQDVRWAELVSKHPKASVFQTVGWLEALQRTYGYSPAVFTTSPLNGPLENGAVFCHVHSWLTGDRIVSLPFSDHCEPLFDSERDLHFIVETLQTDLQRREWKYIEFRPIDGIFFHGGEKSGFRAASRYCFHRLDLRPELDCVFRRFDRDSVQRRILRAERAGLVYRCGTSRTLLHDFYNLLVLTRRRHHFPPQPFLWFRNLVGFMKDALQIRLAYNGQIPIAAVLTLRFRNTVYYKYGCSDVKFKSLGGMPFLFWKAIEESKMTGAEEFDLGRSDTDNPGLISFKNKWGQAPTELVYWRFPAPNTTNRKQGRTLNLAKRVFARMPNCLLVATGRVVYRHIG